MRRVVFVFGFVLLLIAGCQKDESGGCGNLEEQPVFFQYRYQNFAWGHQDRGWLIDGAGVIKGFNQPGDYRIPDSTGMLSYDDLVHNLQLTDTVLNQISREVLLDYAALIPGAAEGNIGEARYIAADAGGSVLSAYLYNKEADAYQYVFLGASGNWEQFNESPEAEELVDWLRVFNVFWLSD